MIQKASMLKTWEDKNNIPTLLFLPDHCIHGHSLVTGAHMMSFQEMQKLSVKINSQVQKVRYASKKSILYVSDGYLPCWADEFEELCRTLAETVFVSPEISPLFLTVSQCYSCSCPAGWLHSLSFSACRMHCSSGGWWTRSQAWSHLQSLAPIDSATPLLS